MKRSDIVDWKYNLVTQEFLAEIKRRVEGLESEVVGGVLNDDPRILAYKAGGAQALRDILDLDIEE